MAEERIVKVCPFGSLMSLSAFFSGMIAESVLRFGGRKRNVASHRIGAPFLDFFFRQLRERSSFPSFFARAARFLFFFSFFFFRKPPLL